MQAEVKAPNSAPTNANIFDPFAAVPLNNFDGSDLFGAFTSHSDLVSSEPSQNDDTDGSHNNLGGQSSGDSKTPPKKDAFQVKSGIWADSLSRGLIDLNISARKCTSQLQNYLLIAYFVFMCSHMNLCGEELIFGS